MKNKKFLKSLFIALSAIVIFVFFTFYLNSYLKKTIFSGPVSIELYGLATEKYTIEASTPRGNSLYFQHNKKTYYDNSHRAIASIRIKIADSGNFNDTDLLIKINSWVIKKKCTQNGLIILDDTDFNKQSNWAKLYGLIVFMLKKFTGLIVSFFISMVLFLLYIFRKKITSGFITFSDSVIKKPHLFLISWCILGVMFVLLMKPVDLSNSVISFNHPDQIDYQNMAVNFSLGYGINISGKVSSNIDYKTVSSDEDAEKQNYITGKRLDRFPGYSVIVGVLYSIFGINPSFIKVFQLILLLIFALSIPLISKKIWGQNGFWGGIIIIPFIIYSLVSFTQLLLPEIITIVLNLFILYMYLIYRKNNLISEAVILGLLAGLSILIRPSLMIFFGLIFFDQIYLIIRYKEKSRFINFILFASVFLILWVPYNAWAIIYASEKKHTAKTIISKIENNTIDQNTFNGFINNSFYKDLDLSYDDIIFFKYNILPEFRLKRYVDFNNNKQFKKVLPLVFLLYSAEHSHVFFMIRLHVKTSILDINNEFNTDGLIHSEWVKHPDSFYHHDRLNIKSDVIRALNFYYKNPKYLFSISHAKLFAYFDGSLFVKIISWIFIIYIAVQNLFFVIKGSTKHNKNLLLLIIATCLIILLFICKESWIYMILLGVLLLTFEQKSNKIIFLPIVFMAITLYVFPIITYGNPRYMTYYSPIFFVMSGIMVIKSLKFCLKNKIVKYL